MRRVRNADQFLKEYRRLRARYETIFAEWLDEIRHKYAMPDTGEPPASLKTELEWHRREFFVNALLAALNWRSERAPEEGLPNIVPEARVRSEETGNTKRLDYLGLETDTDRPLLVVETKRPASPLPRLADDPAATVSEALAGGLDGRELRGKWAKWLAQLTDYVRSIHRRVQLVPKRLLLTDGDWFVLFLDPGDAFLENGSHDPDLMVYFASREELEREASMVFCSLEYARLLEERGPLLPEEVPFHVGKRQVERLMHGLRIHYIDKQVMYGSREPEIHVSPVVLIRLHTGTWLHVEALSNAHPMPFSTKSLREHVGRVAKSAKALMRDVKERLGLRKRVASLTEHYGDPVAFAELKGVKTLPDTGDPNTVDFLVLTGTRKHYLTKRPTVRGCQFHDHKGCFPQTGHGSTGPIYAPCTDPRSFFVSGQDHHCAQGGVYVAKSQPVDDSNRTRCGLRSAEDGQAFCEIFRFETHLCCRACVFEEICTRAQVFRLPCS